MSYNDLNQSIEDGAPIELYRFSSNKGNTPGYDYYYTTNHNEVTFGGHTYLPMQVERSDIPISAVLASPEEMTITLPRRGNELATLYSLPFAPPDLFVRVYRRFRNDPDIEPRKLFYGYATAFTPIKGSLFEITAAPWLQMMFNRRLPSARYMNKCNHELYNSRCTLNKADYTWTTVVTWVDEHRSQFIEVASDFNDDHDLERGELIVGNERQLILDNVDNTIKTSYPFVNVKVGDVVTIVAGCNKTKPRCIEYFDNYINYGGNPLSPNRNITRRPDISHITASAVGSASTNEADGDDPVS